MNNSAASTVRSALTNESAEQLLHDLVATPSVSHQEADAVRLLVGWMAVHGYDQAYVDAVGNAVGIIGSGDQDLVLLGHIDTFPGFPDVSREGRLLYGRGAVDAKGPLCAFAAAALRARIPANLRVVVIGAVEEEAASSKGAHYAATQFQPRACIIGEPSRWDRITLGYKGRLLIEWTWRGALAHSAGIVLSPAEQAVAYWDKARAYANGFNAGKTTLFEQLDASLREIHSGQDGTHGHARCVIGFRLPLGVTPDIVLEAIHPDNGASIRAYGGEIAFAAERDTLLSRAVRGAIRSQSGQPKFLYKTGTADMNVVGPLWNCPIVAYGPGDSALDHTPDEHIDLDEYLRAVDVLAETLSALTFG